MNNAQLQELRETAYGMSVANLNPEDVADYMNIASACARMESRRANQESKYTTTPETPLNTPIPCECVNWCSHDVDMVILTGHHENCPHRKNSKAILDFIKELVRGMEAWACEQDGIHPDAYDAYLKGKALLREDSHWLKKT